MSKQEESAGSGHARRNSALAAGAALGALGVGAKIWYAHKETQRKLMANPEGTADVPRQPAEDMAALLNNPDLKVDPRLIAKVASSVYLASTDTARALRPSVLRAQLGPEVGRHALYRALGYLRDEHNNFVRTVPTGGRGQRGYKATERLVQVFVQLDEVDGLATLADAQNENLMQALLEGRGQEYYGDEV